MTQDSSGFFFDGLGGGGQKSRKRRTAHARAKAGNPKTVTKKALRHNCAFSSVRVTPTNPHKNRPKTSTRKPRVSTQNKRFGNLLSSRTASPRRAVHFEIVGVFRALTGTIFVPILLPNMSGAILAVRFLPPPPQAIKGEPR